MAKQRPTEAEIRTLLNQPYFGPATSDSELVFSDPIDKTPMVVAIDQIEEYDGNPRRAENPLYKEIQESFRSRGQEQPLTITRRPGAPRYMVHAGGNTRLRIMRDRYSLRSGSDALRTLALGKPSPSRPPGRKHDPR